MKTNQAAVVASALIANLFILLPTGVILGTQLARGAHSMAFEQVRTVQERHIKDLMSIGVPDSIIEFQEGKNPFDLTDDSVALIGDWATGEAARKGRSAFVSRNAGIKFVAETFNEKDFERRLQILAEMVQ